MGLFQPAQGSAAADRSLGTESVLVGLIPLDGSPGSHIFKYFIGADMTQSDRWWALRRMHARRALTAKFPPQRGTQTHRAPPIRQTIPVGVFL